MLSDTFAVATTDVADAWPEFAAFDCYGCHRAPVAAIDPVSGVFSWTPSETQGPGSYPFTVRVSDGVTNTDASITLTVIEVNSAPTLSDVPSTATIPELAAYTFTATATMRPGMGDLIVTSPEPACKPPPDRLRRLARSSSTRAVYNRPRSST